MTEYPGNVTSRYSDWNGYWLFGFVVNDLERLDHDLLIPVANSPDKTPLAHIRSLATTKLNPEQLSKTPAQYQNHIRQANLILKQLPGCVEVQVEPISQPRDEHLWLSRALHG